MRVCEQLPNTEKQVFEVALFKNKYAGESLFTNLDTLSRYGEFSIPVRIWDLMSLYACWIEPVAINEWLTVMLGYEKNQVHFDEGKLRSALAWIKPERTTEMAREKVKEIKSSGATVSCVWSKKTLHAAYHIDHCLPFSRWPSNDLWNLLPTSNQSNLAKSDKLASNQRLQDSKENIQQWRRDAWVDNNNNQEQRFFAETSMSLPGLSNNDNNIDDIFEALKLQHVRMKEMQQLRVW